MYLGEQRAHYRPEDELQRSSEGGQNASHPGPDEHLFGIKRKTFFSPHDFSDDYEQRFPEDRMGEETGPNARVWRTYLAESAAFDENMVGEARDGLDAMLVFAGLFSAVVTSFLVQTSQNLQVNYTEMSAYLLYDLATAQRAAAEGAPINSISASPLNPNTQFVPDVRDIWVNGLWVVSLTLSLVVALSAVLIKQWLHRYIALRSGTPKDRSHIRHYRYIGFRKWQVLSIIGSLPVITHLSLGLFLLGLVLFLIPLHPLLSCIVGALTFIVYTLYFTTNMLPIFFPECAYQTPFSDFMFVFGARLRSLASRVRALAFSLRQLVSDAFAENDDSSTGYDDESSVAEAPSPGKSALSLKDLQKSAIEHDYSLSVKALHWLYHVSSNSSVHSVVLQAIGGLPATVVAEVPAIFRYPDVKLFHERLLLSCTTDTKQPRLRQATSPQLQTVAERLCRTSLFFPDHPIGWSTTFPSSEDPSLEATSLAHSSWTALDYRAFISSHHNVLHHPLVWMRLVQNANRAGAFLPYKSRAIFCRALLPAVWDPPSSSPTASSENMTMHAAIRSHMHDEFCRYMLGLLHSYDRRDSPRSTRVIAAAMEYAFDHVTEHPAKFKSVYWDIIDHVFRQFNDYAEDMSQELNDFLTDFVPRLIDGSHVCSRPTTSEIHRERRTSVLKVYWGTRGRLVHGPNGKPFDEFASLRRTVSGTLSEMSSVVQNNPNSSLSTSESFASNVHQILDILSLALQSGCTEAYQIVVDHRCLELLVKYIREEPLHTALLGPYVAGLSLVEPTSRKSYIEYLYEPANLCIAALSTFALSHDDQIGLDDLTQLDPENPAWAECRRCLALVSAEWTNEDKALTRRSFFEREQWMSKVLEFYLTWGETRKPFGTPSPTPSNSTSASSTGELVQPSGNTIGTRLEYDPTLLPDYYDVEQPLDQPLTDNIFEPSSRGTKGEWMLREAIHSLDEFLEKQEAELTTTPEHEKPVTRPITPASYKPALVKRPSSQYIHKRRSFSEWKSWLRDRILLWRVEDEEIV